MVRTSSPRRQSAASQTGSIDATAHPFIPKQILKKKAISKSEYLLREEWAPETINEYQMIVGEPSVTPVPPPKPTPSVQQQQRPQRPQQQTNTVSNRHGQGRGPNRCMQSQARSSSMFEEWKARSVVTPEKAKGKDKTKETDGDSTASLQGDHKPGNGTAPKVPDINLKETNAAPTASSPKHHKPKLNAAPTVSEHTVKQASHTPIVPVLGPNKMGGGAASGDDMVKDSSVTPTASSQPPRTEGNATPVVEKNKAKETNSTPTASPQVPKTEGGAAPITRDDKGSHVAPTPTLKTKHRRRSSAASGVTNKVRGTRAVPTSMPQAPKSDGGAAPVVKANKVNGTDAAAVPLSRNKHKRGGSAVSITSSHKTKGAGVTSAVSTQAGNKAEVNVPIIDDNKVERSGVTFNASPQVNGKTEESPASVNSAGEHPDKAVENQIEPNQTCDVKFHQQKPENLAGGSAEIHTPAPSASVTIDEAANPTRSTRTRANKKGTTIDKQDDKSRPRERVPEYAYTAPTGAGFTLSELGNLKIGVKLDGPDKVYFLPCFIEDPWRGMEPSRPVQPAPEARKVLPAEAMRWLPAPIW